MSEMRIALEVRLYEDILYEFHWQWREYNALGAPEADRLLLFIRRLEANAYEVTWQRRK